MIRVAMGQSPKSCVSSGGKIFLKKYIPCDSVNTKISGNVEKYTGQKAGCHGGS
jgi:hypothetical protein